MLCDWCGEKLTFWTTKTVTLRAKNMVRAGDTLRGVAHVGEPLHEVVYQMHIACAARSHQLSEGIAAAMLPSK